MADWAYLRTLAEAFHDTQQARISISNRVMATDDPERFGVALAPIETAEAEIKSQLIHEYREEVPAEILSWQESHKGLGEHLVARLLGHLGHPVIAQPYHWEGTGSKRTLVADPQFNRTVGQLWSYCGHGDPVRKKVKGMSVEQAMALGSPICKMLVWNLSTAAVKRKVPEDVRSPSPGTKPNGVSGNAKSARSTRRTEPNVSATGRTSAQPREVPKSTASTVEQFKYRLAYEARREVTAERVHAAACIRCGPSGRPAQPDSPWNKGHQFADALRIVGKEILRDLWIVSAESIEGT